MTNKKERGAASILIELFNGQITIKHGTYGECLAMPVTVIEGTWNKLFATVKEVISENRIDD